MNILVTFASRHGNTRAIAEAIAAELETCGHRTVFSDVSRVTSLDGYDAIIVGSGLYFGHWLPQVPAFLDRFRPQLATLPVWLFCSGPLGRQPAATPDEVTSHRAGMRLMGHRCFPGNLDPASLGTRERFATRMVGGPVSDFRDWDAVHDWTRRIAASLGPIRMPARSAGRHPLVTA